MGCIRLASPCPVSVSKLFSKQTLASSGLLLLCAVWLLPGLLGHAPWKGGDGEHFVRFWLLWRGEAALGGTPPLYYWVASATAWLSSPFLPLHDGARLASGLFVALALFFVARAARALYGAAAAWPATLTLLGCLGLLVRGHETNAYTAQFAAVAILLYGLARLPHDRRGGWALAVGGVLLLLAGGAAETMTLLLLALALPWLLPAWREPATRRALHLGVAGAVLCAIAWIALLAARAAPLTQALGMTPWLGEGALRPLYYPGILGWYAWPAWPLAAWALYRARRNLREAGTMLPLAVFAVLLGAYALSSDPGEEQGLVLLPPLALLASAGLLTLRRGAANALLWFSITLFSFIGLVFWAYWSAHDLGVPARLAARLGRLGMTHVGELRPWALAVGVGVTLAWGIFLLQLRPSSLRPILAWTAGMSFVWVLLMALFLRPLDQRLSYVGVAGEIARRVPVGACVQTHAMRSEQRLLLTYHSGRWLVPADLGCRWLLLETRERGAVPGVSPDWIKVWEGARPGERGDRFHLYVRR